MLRSRPLIAKRMAQIRSERVKKDTPAGTLFPARRLHGRRGSKLAGGRENSIGSSVFEGKNTGSKRETRRTHLGAYYAQRELVADRPRGIADRGVSA